MSDKLKKSEYEKEYQQKNKEVIKERKRLWWLANKEKAKVKNKIWRDENKDHIRNYQNIYTSTKYKTDTLYKLTQRIRKSIKKSLKIRTIRKKTTTIDILGCSFDEFKIHLESKFEPWMNWDNYGLYNGELNHGWDIDHIIPISSGQLEEEIIRLNHYTNLQPLCSYINRIIKRDNKLWNS